MTPTVTDFTALLAAMAPITVGFEGSIPHMYLDNSKFGIVTCGVGFALEEVENALELPWYTQDSGPNVSHQSTRSEISFDFKRVAAMCPGRAAGTYRCPTSPLLTEGDITRILEQDLGGFASELIPIFPDYMAWPLPAQLAILDMAYNLGIAGLKKYTHLLAGASAELWVKCANECHRNGIDSTRNSWTFTKFMQAAASGR